MFLGGNCMSEFTSRVSLKKPEPWTDPVTGEIYPDGMPSTAAQSAQPYAQPAQPYAQPAQPYAQPAQPYAQPAQPYAQPAQPYAQPAQPYAQPANGSYSAAEVYPGAQNPPQPINQHTCFCRSCGSRIEDSAQFCRNCGAQQFPSQQPAPQQYQQPAPAPTPVIINNYNNNNVNNVASNNMVNVGGGRLRNKWVAFILCFFFGYMGVHRFYEHKIPTGILWLFTFGLFGIGWLIDLLVILCKPTNYYV